MRNQPTKGRSSALGLILFQVKLQFTLRPACKRVFVCLNVEPVLRSKNMSDLECNFALSYAYRVTQLSC